MPWGDFDAAAMPVSHPSFFGYQLKPGQWGAEPLSR